MDTSEILEAVQNGTRHFASAGNSIGALETFQTLVAQLNELERLGHLRIVDTRRESFTGQRLISVVSVESSD